MRIDPIYDNRKMIGLLRERGLIIKDRDEKKIKKIEAQINLEKMHQYDRPICGGFITFET